MRTPFTGVPDCGRVQAKINIYIFDIITISIFTFNINKQGRRRPLYTPKRMREERKKERERKKGRMRG